MNEFILDRVTFDTINLKWKHGARIQHGPVGLSGVNLNCSERIKQFVQRIF